MSNGSFFGRAMLVMGCLIALNAACAEPGDPQSVAKARRDYAEAMKGHDAGLQNAMKTELAYQLAKAKERREAAKNSKKHSARAQPPSPRNTAS